MHILFSFLPFIIHKIFRTCRKRIISLTTYRRTSLPSMQSSWLLGLAGVDLPAPKMEDDPNLACNNIIASTKKLGFAAPGCVECVILCEDADALGLQMCEGHLLSCLAIIYSFGALPLPYPLLVCISNGHLVWGLTSLEGSPDDGPNLSGNVGTHRPPLSSPMMGTTQPSSPLP